MSRALDRLVAEHVFGVAPRDIRAGGTGKTVRCFTTNPYFVDGQCTEHELRTQAGAAHYSTSIKHAWEVVEAMREKGFYVDMSVSPDGISSVRMFRVNGKATRWVEGAEALALVICKAALRALGVEITA